MVVAWMARVLAEAGQKAEMAAALVATAGAQWALVQ
jgi:hypothetical protein